MLKIFNLCSSNMGVISWDQLSQDQFSRDQLLHTIIANHKLSSLKSPMKLLQLWGTTHQQPYWRVAFKVEKVVGGPHSNIWCLQEGRSDHKDENVDAGTWSTAGPKAKTGEAKGETNSELVCSIQFWSNVSDWLATEWLATFFCLFFRTHPPSDTH